MNLQDPSKCVRTEVTLAKEEFEEFNVALCTQVTFCLKELRAILSFAEALVLELECRMEGAGRLISNCYYQIIIRFPQCDHFLYSPVLFSLNKDGLYSADFLLSTLSPSIDSTPSSGATLTPRASVARNPSSSVMRNASGKFYNNII